MARKMLCAFAAIVSVGLGSACSQDGTENAQAKRSALDSIDPRPGPDVCAAVVSSTVSKALKLSAASSSDSESVNQAIPGAQCTYVFHDGFAVTIAYLTPADFLEVSAGSALGTITSNGQGFSSPTAAGLELDGEAVVVMASDTPSQAMRQGMSRLAATVLSELEPGTDEA